MAPQERTAKAVRTLEMFTLFNDLRPLMRDERGVTALEYGLIAGLVAVVIVTAVTSLGTQLAATFTSIVSALP